MLERERVPDKGLRLRPLFAAALVMLILWGSLFLFDKTTRLPPEPGYAMSRLEFMMGDDLPAAHLEQLSALAEAPLTEEMDCLKKDAAALAAFLAGCLNRISSSLSSNPALK